MTRLSLLRRLALAGVCSAAIGAGGVLLPATAFAVPMDCGPQTADNCFGGGGGGGIFGGPVIPPAPGFGGGPFGGGPAGMEPDLQPRLCHFDYELRHMVCD